MVAAAVVYELFIPDCHTLKQKRAVVKPIVDGLQRRFKVSAAETGWHDKWQRAEVSIAVVAGTEGHAGEVLAAVERFVWSFPEVQVLQQRIRWLEEE